MRRDAVCAGGLGNRLRYAIWIGYRKKGIFSYVRGRYDICAGVLCLDPRSQGEGIGGTDGTKWNIVRL